MNRLGLVAYRRWHSRPIPWTHCPKCNEHFSEEPTFTAAAVPETREAIYKYEVWEGDDGGPFVASIRCRACGTTTQAAGEWGVEPKFEYDPKYGEVPAGFGVLYTPKWLSHFPELAPGLGDKVPQNIRAELLRADATFWSDLRSCATALRATVEVFLDDQGIPRQGLTKKNKPYRMMLGDRTDAFIEMIRKVRPHEVVELETLLTATRVVGNEGTHEGEPITERDIRIVAQALGDVLRRLYVGNEIVQAAERILAARQPSRVGKKTQQVGATTPAALVTPGPQGGMGTGGSNGGSQG